MAQIVLLVPLSTASHEARSPFLKSECFRLLSLVLAIKPDPQAPSDLDKAAAGKVQEQSKHVVDAINTALEDDEMRKAKRVRSVLKVIEKFVPVLSGSGSSEVIDGLKKVTTLLNDFSTESESKPLQTLCNKLKEEIDGKVTEMEQQRQKEEEAAAAGNGGGSGGGGSTSKKLTPKSKKKKKKKK